MGAADKTQVIQVSPLVWSGGLSSCLGESNPEGKGAQNAVSSVCRHSQLVASFEITEIDSQPGLPHTQEGQGDRGADVGRA